jgi:Na+-translocating ferredoxin:NAD+ oxidoreductase RnfC subunit
MGIFKKLFGGGGATTLAKMSGQEAEKIIQAYGTVLQTQAPTPGCVADISKLPFSKEKIKAAIIIGLKSTNDQQMREMLKVAYIQ